MSIEVHLVGQLTDGSLAEGWLTRVQSWLHETWSNTLVASVIREHAGSLTLAFQLHPSAEDVLLRAVAGGVEATCTTAGIGPGYHAHVCEVLQAMAEEMAVRWSAPPGHVSDPTGFFETGSIRTLETEMLRWLASEARALLSKPSLTGASIALPGEHTYSVGDAVATPLGPRDREWLRRVAAEPERGMDVFAWWEPGIGPRVLLGRALVLMWTEVRWRRPMLDSEIAQVTEVLELLRKAQTASPGLEYPWREWAELQKHLRDRTSLPPFHGEPAAPLVGYRRSPVVVRLASGWSVEIPGSFAEAWDERGSFTGWAEGKTLSVTAWQGSEQPEELLEKPLSGERVELPGLPPEYTRAATLSDYSEGAEVLRRLRAAVRIGDRVALVTATVDAAQEQPWAIQAASTLRYGARAP